MCCKYIACRVEINHRTVRRSTGGYLGVLSYPRSSREKLRDLQVRQCLLASASRESQAVKIMPITAEIDKFARLVVTTGTGQLTKTDFLAHIDVVWSDPAIVGFDELIDTFNADLSALTSEDIAALVKSGVSIDSAISSKLTLCVGTELGYGLGRMYGSMRDTHADNAREVKVFYDLDFAHQWLAEGRGRGP